MPHRNASEIRLTGVAASPGVAHGPAFVFFQDTPEVPCYEVAAADIPEETGRFEKALVATRSQISRLRQEVGAKLGEAEAEIFDAHLLVLEDPALIGETLSTLNKTRRNIEHCFHLVTQRYMDFFAKMDDEYLKERVADIRDVSGRVMNNLLGLGRNNFSEMTESRVVVSEDLSPSDTATFSSGHVLAIITDGGNRTSHAVIMARSMRVPAVVGLRDATRKIRSEDSVLVDGFEGVVYVRPSAETLSRYGRFAESRRVFDDLVAEEIDLPDVTADGQPFTLRSNVGGPEDLAEHRRVRSSGVGLFRSEALFLKNNAFPDEETQYAAYRKVVEELAPAPVVIRTLDIGGDKQMPAMKTAGEENPFMGFRAIRFCLEHRDIFKTQLRAILRAGAHGRTALMFPMIASLDELLRAKAILRETSDELRVAGIPHDPAIPVGVMIEIPSAALMADTLAGHCDFFSVGTNDLVQYLLAVDRGNERIAHLYDPCQPVVMRVLRGVVEAARRHGIPVGVCGEIAGDPTFAPLLLGLGVDALSMTASSVPELRYLLRRSTTAELRQLADAALAETDPRKIEARLRAFAEAKFATSVRA